MASHSSPTEEEQVGLSLEISPNKWCSFHMQESENVFMLPSSDNGRVSIPICYNCIRILVTKAHYERYCDEG